MKTKTLKKNKVNVVTLGCSKNTFDSEVIHVKSIVRGYDFRAYSDRTLPSGVNHLMAPVLVKQS